ncbi:hypothetical protein CWE12_05075 [Aliidiomarina sedimenti]|uniref:Uncharacterized protein n=1 Tax=Aliidiomarina sedimenti TaxID=1933879 RepID=A0ABY0C0G5_9GAMM|nr:hypothetical protein [Aliidiomarina sedimenti]RUO30624.1 hypothetical protein CWE12_05075 [Aliidiomarina sedimenti]
MLNVTSSAAVTYNTDTSAQQQQREQQSVDQQRSDDLIRALQGNSFERQGFLEEAQRLTLLNRMGVDIDALNEVESRIEDLESVEERTQLDAEKLESLYEQRKELFRQANERANGESLPPGSMLSLTV